MDWKKNPPFGYKEHDHLIKAFRGVVESGFSRFELKPVISDQRLTECFFAWRYDLEKSVDRFRPDIRKSTPDHVKCAGYLMYWIRRTLPIVSIEDVGAKWATEAERSSILGRIVFSRNEGLVGPDWVELDSQGEAELPEEVRAEFEKEHGLSILQYVEHSNRLKNYPNEYAAWDFCYRLAASYEKLKREQAGESQILRNPSFEFIDDFCYYLKYKSVSPHSLAFTLRTAIQE